MRHKWKTNTCKAHSDILDRCDHDLYYYIIRTLDTDSSTYRQECEALTQKIASLEETHKTREIELKSEALTWKIKYSEALDRLLENVPT